MALTGPATLGANIPRNLGATAPVSRSASGGVARTQQIAPSSTGPSQAAIGASYGNYMNAFGPEYANRAIDIAGLGMNQQMLRDRGAYDTGVSNLSGQSLRNDYSLASRDLASDRASLGLRRQQNNLGLQSNAIDRNQIGAQRDFAGRERDQAIGNAMREGIMQTKLNDSNYISRGAYFAPFRGMKNEGIRADTMAAGDRARLGYDTTMSGLGAREQKLGLDDQGIKIADQLLATQASQLGVKADQLAARLNEGLAKLGLDGQLNAQQLMYGLAQGDLKYQDIMKQVHAAALQNSAMMTSGTGGDVMKKFMPGW